MQSMQGKLLFVGAAEMFDIFFPTKPGFEFRPPFDFVNPN